MASWLRFIMCLGMLFLGLGGWGSARAAPPSYQASGTAVSGTGSVSPAWPTHAVNDVALLFVESTGGQAVTLSTAAGFVEVTNSPQASGSGTAGTRLTVFWARATSTSMSAPTIADPGDHVYAQILTYRNVYRYGNPWDITAGGVKASASTALTVSSMTTTMSDTMVVQAAARDDDSSAASFSAQTNASLASIVERSDTGTTSGNGGGFSVWDGQMPSAGATGATTVTVVNSINAFLSIALKPDVFEVSKTASLASVPINTNFTFTLSARNPVNAADQAAVSITDDLGAAGLNFASCSTVSGTCSYTAGIVTWNVGAVAAGTTKTATLVVNASSVGAKINTITANVGTPAASGSATVQAYAPLADWRMDEASWNGTANEVKDSSGNGYHGRARIANGSTSVPTTANTAPQAYTSGGQSTCGYGEFDRTSSPVRTYSYVELTGIPPLPSSFTFAAWIRSTNASAQHQRILVRDDADNGWGLSLADGTGQAELRFFNRNITNSGAVTGQGRNPSCGVFCLDTNPVIVSNAWHFIAAAIDTSGQSVTLYVYDASGNLLAKTSSAYSGTWKDGTGLAAIGGETSTSLEGTQTSWHFLGNIDELQIYSGVLGQADLDVLRTRSRTCGVSVDHYELSVPTNSLTCLPSTVTVTACANASSPCTSPVTTISGQTATLSSGAATLGSSTITFNASGVATTTLSYPLATDGASVTVTLSGEQVTANNARQCCPNGTSCTVANSCSTTFSSCSVAAANFNVVDSYYANQSYDSAADHRIYTKLAGWNEATGAAGNTSIKLDVVALKSTGVTETSYVASGASKNVTVQLFDDASGTPCNSSGAACSACSKTVVATVNPLTFSPSDLGYQNDVTFALGNTNAYPRLIARVMDSNSGTIYGCSTDAFAVRPMAFAVSSSNATADSTGTSTSASPVIKAGASFALTANPSASGYTGTPTLGASSTVAAHSGATTTGALAGAFSAATSGSAYAASGAVFTYDDVGYFRLNADGVVDATFAAVDSSGNDCVVGSTSNTKAAGKYGCSVGSAQSPYFGRFIPDHFVLSGGSVNPACGTFSYMEQPFGLGFTLTAVNASGGTTLNYVGSYAKISPTTAALWPSTTLGATGFALGAVNGGGDVSTRLSLVGTPTGTWTNGATNVAANFEFSRPMTLSADATWGPYNFLDFGIAPQDSDDTKLLPAALNLDVSSPPGAERQKLHTAHAIQYYGRVRLDNAYGSELLDLPMTMRLEYWNGTGWVLNNADTCTALAASQFAWAFSAGTATRPNNLNACESVVTVTGAAPNYIVRLSAPGATNSGWADLTLNLGTPASGNQCTTLGGVGPLAVTAAAPWLQYRWTNPTGPEVDPTGRATFGIYKSPLIYRRENY